MVIPYQPPVLPVLKISNNVIDTNFYIYSGGLYVVFTLTNLRSSQKYDLNVSDQNDVSKRSLKLPWSNSQDLWYKFTYNCSNRSTIAESIFRHEFVFPNLVTLPIWNLVIPQKLYEIPFQACVYQNGPELRCKLHSLQGNCTLQTKVNKTTVL